MLIENNTLLRIDPEDIIDGVFTAPDNVFYIGHNFACGDVVKMILPNVVKIGMNFLRYNKILEYLEIPNLTIIEYGFLFTNKKIKYLCIPKVEYIGDSFLYFNDTITSLVASNIKRIGKYFLYHNTTLRVIDMPIIKEIDRDFLHNNPKFNYTLNIIKALKEHMYICGETVDKMGYIRKLKLKKLLC